MKLMENKKQYVREKDVEVEDDQLFSTIEVSFSSFPKDKRACQVPSRTSKDRSMCETTCSTGFMCQVSSKLIDEQSIALARETQHKQYMDVG